MVLARLLLAGLGQQDATAPHWVAMGPASITVLAAAQILRVTGAPAVNVVRAVITGLAVIFRALASCLIPPLIARSIWRHLHRNAPLRYRSDLWMIVFPADMSADHRIDAPRSGRVEGCWRNGGAGDAAEDQECGQPAHARDAR